MGIARSSVISLVTMCQIGDHQQEHQSPPIQNTAVVGRSVWMRDLDYDKNLIRMIDAFEMFGYVSVEGQVDGAPNERICRGRGECKAYLL